MNPFELHPERLSTTDEIGRRVFVYPADVKGKFRLRRTQVQAVLIFVFLLLPWLKIDGRQALLLDVASRKFEIFGLSLRAHNAPLFFFVLAMAGFGLFFVTAVWGRIWCGWACPQTVFIDAVFRRIERWIEGPALERRRLAQAPWDKKKVAKFSLKWFLFLIASMVLTHSFLAYFVGTEELAHMIARSPIESPTSFIFIVVSTAIILFDFAWFREQFCSIVCPYGRFQSVLMDSHSTVVAYDVARGEPRGTPQAKALAKTHGTKLGDCVNCYRCVQVCPAGIDIRRGVQMECIACTACIDACDDVMTKIKKPTGLIRYDSLRGLQNKPRQPLRLRSLIYLSISIASFIALLTFLAILKPIDVIILRAKEIPYTVDASGIVTNHFKVEVSNQSHASHRLHFSVSGYLEREGLKIITAYQGVEIAAGQSKSIDIFARFPADLIHEGQETVMIKIDDEDVTSGAKNQFEKGASLVGPIL